MFMNEYGENVMFALSRGGILFTLHFKIYLNQTSLQI